MKKNKIAVIGLGPMGRALTILFLKNKNEVSIWNRTQSKTTALVNKGAINYDSVATLLQNNDTIFLSLTDYKVMYAVLNGNTRYLKGKTIINLSSDTPENARAADRWASGFNANYLTGAIMVEPQTLGGDDSFVFYSGRLSVFAGHESLLSILGNAYYLGEDHGTAQLFSIALLNVLFSSATGILHSLALLKAEHVNLTRFEPHLNNFLKILPYMLADTVAQADVQLYDGSMNNMQMMYAAMTHVADASKDAGINTEVSDLIARLFKQTITMGYGQSGLTSIIEVLKSKKIQRNQHMTLIK